MSRAGPRFMIALMRAPMGWTSTQVLAMAQSRVDDLGKAGRPKGGSVLLCVVLCGRWLVSYRIAIAT